MAITVGPPRLDIAPLHRDGNVEAGIRGNHRGPAAGLNVHNPQPGMHYYHCRHPKADRRGAQYRRFVNMGWEAVPPGAPEFCAESGDLRLKELGIDGFHINSDVILMRISEERYRRQVEFSRLTREAETDGPTNEYLQNARSFDANYGSRADGPIYYKGPGHGNTTL